MKYEFKSWYGGKPQGFVIDDKDFSDDREPAYRWTDEVSGVFLEITKNSKLLARIKPLGETHEDLVYWNATAPGVQPNTPYWLVKDEGDQIHHIDQVPSTKEEFDRLKIDKVSRFATRKAAEDFVRLRNAVMQSHLKKGDYLPVGLEAERSTQMPKGPTGFERVTVTASTLRKVEKAYIHLDEPCMMVMGSDWPMFYKLANLQVKEFNVKPLYEGTPFKIEVSSSGITAKVDGKSMVISVPALCDMVARLYQTEHFNSFTVENSTIDVGCKKGIPRLVLNEVLQYYYSVAAKK